MELKPIPSGADCVDVPLDFASFDFKNVTVENVLKFVQVLSYVRFGNKFSVRWVIPQRERLHAPVSFKVEEPTIRAVLKALSIREKLSVDYQMNSVYVKEY